MKDRNRFLDVLKGIAILLIIFTHYSFTDDKRAAMFFPYWVDMGVPIFMIISGYVTSLSYERKGIKTIDDAYRPVNSVRSLLRFMVPFMIAFIAEIIINILFFGWTEPNIGVIVMSFVAGGNGPGAYYIPVMIQFIFLFPILYRIVRRYGLYGVFMIGGFNVLFEICRMAYQMPEATYCNLIFRYMLIIAYGIWLSAPDYKFHPILGAAALVVGVVFIYAVSYKGYWPMIFNVWSGTSAIACLYIIPIMGLLIKKCGAIHFTPLEMLGKASFDIFLVQKIWYHVWRPVFLTDGIGPYVTQKRLSATYVFCIITGLVFYFVESRLTKLITAKITSSAR